MLSSFCYIKGIKCTFSDLFAEISLQQAGKGFAVACLVAGHLVNGIVKE